jgi:hypothetical protein
MCKQGRTVGSAGGKLENSARAHAGDCVCRYPGAEQWKCLMGQHRLPWLRHPFFLSESQYDSFQLYWALGGRSPPYAGDAQVASERASEREGSACLGAFMYVCTHEARTIAHAHVEVDACHCCKRTVLAHVAELTAHSMCAMYALQSAHCPQAFAEGFRTEMRAAMISASAAPRSGLYSSACFRHCVTLSTEFWTATATTPYAGQVRVRAGPAVVRVRAGERGRK